MCAIAVATTLVACGGKSSPTQPTTTATTTTVTTTGPTTPPSEVPLAPPTTLEHFLTGAGDIGECGRDGARKTGLLLDQLDGAIFTTGDNAYQNGKPDEFRNCYDPYWGRQKGRTYPTPGNHDYGTPGATGYFEYFGAGASGPNGYYSYNLGKWHVVALNSNIAIDAGSAQVAWLRGDLAAAGAKCSLAYFHQPLVSSGDNGGSSRMRDVWRILYEFGVEIVLNGHDHVYERFAPQDPDLRLDTARGIRQFTVGTGGARLYGLPRVERNSEVRASAWGVLRLGLRDGAYSWEFIPVPGEPFHDSGTGACH
jgi:hypothetical protein